MTQPISIRIPDHLLINLDAFAARMGISRTDAILNAITLQNTMLAKQPPTKETTPHAHPN
jgi:metal-responsive CopG/Arc/MetJ family transcriptional regulator